MSDSNALSKKEVFKDWVSQYSDELFSWASYKIKDKHTAEDLVQDTFLSAFNGYENFKGDSKPKTWLLRILNNKIIDHYRKSAKQFERLDDHLQKKEIKLTDNFFDANGRWKNTNVETKWESEQHLLDTPEFNSVLDNCMDKLPENWRMAVLSKYIVQKNAQEICKELNISTSNYWQVIHRSKLMLKKCLELNWFKSEV
ncbi:MAG: sigma-70 family RNA polymerase sigma factor [Bacteroidia bacterium]